MIPLIGVLAFLTVTLLALAVGRAAASRSAPLQRRIEMIASGGATTEADVRAQHLLRMQNYSSLPFVQNLLQRTPRAERIADDLERAGLGLRVGEYLGLSIVLGLLGAFVVLLLLPPSLARVFLAGAVFFAGLYLPRWYVKRRIRRRREQIEAILPDALDMISRSLRTGSGLLIAIDSMLDQVTGPIAAEFTRLQQEIGTGLGVEAAFRELDRRVQSKDLHIAVTAILVHREVGGNLTEILDNVTGMMRERVRLRGEIKALVSRQVFSTYAMAAMPPLIVLLLTVIARPLIQPLFDNRAGWVVLGIAASLEVIGFLIVKRLASSPVEV